MSLSLTVLQYFSFLYFSCNLNNRNECSPSDRICRVQLIQTLYDILTVEIYPLEEKKMQNLIREDLNSGRDLSAVSSMLQEIIDFWGNFYEIYRKRGNWWGGECTIHSASDNEKCILPTSFLPLWVDDMPVFFWPII